MHSRRVPRLRKVARRISVALALTWVVAACAPFEAEPALQITPTGTAGSYLVVLDNCPALREVSLSALPADDGSPEVPVWRIVRNSPPANVANVEIQLGQVPNGWVDELAFETALQSERSYRVDIAPGNRSLEFALSEVDELERGRVITDRGTADLARADVSEPCDGSAAWGNLWRQGAVFFLAGLLILLLIGTALAKALQVLVNNRGESFEPEYYDYDDDPRYGDEPMYDDYWPDEDDLDR